MEKDNKRLIETLITGKNSAKRLQNLLRRKSKDDGVGFADELMTNILGSFSDSLLVLTSTDSGEFCSVPVGDPHVGLACSVDRVSEELTGNSTGKKQAPAVKERRGCYKRRKTADSRIKVSATTEDGYAWRKYGQKEILNSKFPRCYFRCTHKHAHGCKALKQVQKLEDDSDLFHITYFGHHTCPTPHIFSHSGVVLDFKDPKNHHYSPNSPSTITNVHIGPSIKQEDDSKVQSDDISDIVSSASDVRSSLWKEMLQIDDLGPSHEAPSFRGFDHEDSSASTSSQHYLGMEFFKNDGFFNDIELDNMFL